MNNSIIIFDGDCAFCNRFIQQIVKHDNNFFKIIDRNSLLFDKAKTKFHLKPATSIETIYLIENNKVFEKSTAIILILKKCGTVFSIVSILLSIVPRFIRDFLYEIISKMRKKLIKKNACSIQDKLTLQQRTIKTL
jgi:predicted DCC family thiol-disulfide oxidoreductase YuxK